MKIETLDVQGFIPAMHAMRNPKDSWARNDTFLDVVNNLTIGPNDLDLSLRLQKAGPEHCKHLRMIMVWADITAPRYWWIEADTYRNGVEKVSCSTMHKLTSREINVYDFEQDDNAPNELSGCLMHEANIVEEYRQLYLAEENPEDKQILWRLMIQCLPQSYLQKRTVMFSYAALRNIVRQRANHKLNEWHQFIDWVHTLPYADELIFDKEEPLNG